MTVAACASTPTLDGFATAAIQVGDHELTVAMAETTDERSQGLRGLEAFPDGIDGMLFVFGEPRSATFGMRDTPIPLDIWWFDEDGSLVGSTEMEPCVSQPCTSYGSPGDVAWALETPLGVMEFAPGDMLRVVTSS